MDYPSLQAEVILQLCPYLAFEVASSWACPVHDCTTMMAARVFLLCFATASAAETWHLVDLAQVVCPTPVSSNPNAPPYPEYNLGINYTSSMQVDAPHIVSFIRASQQAVTITFSIEDANGQQVVPETTVNLQELSDAVPSTCKCTMPTLPAEVEVFQTCVTESS